MSFLRGFDIPGDLALTGDGRDILFVTGGDKVVQSIKARAQIFQGSWRYDLTVGVPYLQEILVSGAELEKVRRRFYELIAETDGVTSVQKVDIRFDFEAQEVLVAFECTADGESLSGVLDFVAVT